MKTLTVEIEGQVYPVKFGYKAYRFLADQWEISKLSQLGAEFGKLGFKPGEEPEMEVYEKLGDIILAGVLCAGKSDAHQIPVDRDDCVDYFLHNMEALGDIIGAFAASFPKQESEGDTGKQKKGQKK